MKKILILSLLGLSYGLNAMDSQPPRPSTSSATTSAQEQQAEKTCPICLDKLGTEGGVEALACGDVFCSTCIRRAMQPSNAKCPCCRKTKAQLEQLSRGQRPTPTPARRRRGNTPQISDIPQMIPSVIEEIINQLAVVDPTSPIVQEMQTLVQTVRQTQRQTQSVVPTVIPIVQQFFNTLFNS